MQTRTSSILNNVCSPPGDSESHDTDDRSQQENDLHSSKAIGDVKEGLDYQATVGPLEHRRVSSSLH